jgi:2'-5' RNA ligase
MASVGARVFVGVDIGEAMRREAQRVISALAVKLEQVKEPPKVAWVKPMNLHVTIRFLGEVDDATVERLIALVSPPISIAPFEVSWRGIGAFPSHRNPRALWLGVINGAAQLAAVEAEVSRRIAGSIEPLDDRALLPHLTLGRIKMAGKGIDWPKILKACELRNVISSIDRVTLFRSQLSQHGPNYTELVSAPLIGP